jgi:hypothetical protein
MKYEVEVEVCYIYAIEASEKGTPRPSAGWPFPAGMPR